jgi:hypothetical protein
MQVGQQLAAMTATLASCSILSKQQKKNQNKR